MATACPAISYAMELSIAKMAATSATVPSAGKMPTCKTYPPKLPIRHNYPFGIPGFTIQVQEKHLIFLIYQLFKLAEISK